VSKENDILISVRAPVGDINFADKEYAIGRGLAIIRNFSNNLLIWYVYWLLASMKENWEAKGSFFSAITKEIIIKKVIPIPPIVEQQYIVNYLTNYFVQMPP